MLQDRHKLLALVIGVALVMLAVYLDKHWAFNSFYLIGHMREWMVGAREINHMIGLFGLALALWYFIISFSSRRLVATNLVITLVGAVVIMLTNAENNWLFNVFGISRSGLLCDLSPIYIGMWVLLGLVVWRTPNVLRPVPALVGSCGALVLTTVVWECYVQPFNNVYQKDPRGWIEWSQVFFDLGGIGAAALIIFGITRLGGGQTNQATRVAGS